MMQLRKCTYPLFHPPTKRKARLDPAAKVRSQRDHDAIKHDLEKQLQTLREGRAPDLTDPGQMPHSTHASLPILQPRREPEIVIEPLDADDA